jgi:hypothetical protein
MIALPKMGNTMANKWTKASRAKLSRSQKARWKERKRHPHRSAFTPPPALRECLHGLVTDVGGAGD